MTRQWHETPGLHEVPAHELLSRTRITSADSLPGEEEHHTALRKQDESLESGLAGHIAEHGVKSPVVVGVVPKASWNGREMVVSRRQEFLDGNHRAVSAAMADPDMKVPVRVVEGTASEHKRTMDADHRAHGQGLPRVPMHMRADFRQMVDDHRDLMAERDRHGRRSGTPTTPDKHDKGYQALLEAILGK